MNSPESARAPLAPGSWLGLLGGGQLGRMFAMAAQSMGYRVCVLDPGADSPAGAVADRWIRAAYEDPAALAELASLCGAVTTEFENVPAAALEALARSVSVSPRAASVEIAQDRMREKAFARRCGLAVVPYCEVRAPADLEASDEALYPAILKAARLGYDGKGQARVANRAEALAAFEVMGAVPCVLEKMLALDVEVSALVARGFDGESVVYPIAQNLHRHGILASSTVPARISQDVAWRAADAAQRIAAELDYVGVLCVEFFVLADGSLLVNEMAPRPHNSGHYSIDACVTSQFEQQARIMARLPLGDAHQLAPAVMINLLGDLWYADAASAQAREPDWRLVLRHPRAKLHLYGKTEPRRGRKMGHVTVLDETAERAMHVADDIAHDLGIG